MGLEIIKGADPVTETGKVKLDRKLWQDADGNVVEDGDPSAAILIGPEGRELPVAQARKFGLVDADGKLIQPSTENEPAPEPKKAPAKPRTPAKKKPRTPAKSK